MFRFRLRRSALILICPWACEVDIVVEPAVQDAQTQLKLALDEALASQEQLTAGDDYMKLPDRVEGVPVSWSERPDSSPEILLGLGGMVIALIFARKMNGQPGRLKGAMRSFLRIIRCLFIRSFSCLARG